MPDNVQKGSHLIFTVNLRGEHALYSFTVQTAEAQGGRSAPSNSASM